MQQIFFHTYEIAFKFLSEDPVRNWILAFVSAYDYEIKTLTYVFMSDASLLQLNQDLLDHDYYTDIITLPFSEKNEPIIADIYISIDRVRENAMTYQVDFWDELHRVMIHGLIHLLGFDDKTPKEIIEMRQLEDKALNMRSFDVPRGT